MGKPVGDPMDDGLFQALLVEDRRIEERGKKRITVDRFHRFVADRTPDRIDPAATCCGGKC